MLLVKSTISIISLNLFTFGFIDFWLAMNDPLPQKLESVCSKDEHNFPLKLSLNVSVSMMPVFQQWVDDNQLFKYTILFGKFIGISIY